MVKGHAVRVPQAAMGVARFSFDDLCAQPLAAADYLKIAHEFHTIILDHIPVMDFARRNEAKRFIILIDTLYDHAVKLVASAQAQPDELYRGERRLRGAGIQAHRLAPDRDALAVLSRPAAWAAAGARLGLVRKNRGDLKLFSRGGTVMPEQTPAAASPPRKRPRPHCAICGKEAREPIRFSMVRPAIAGLMTAEHPNLSG